MRVYLDHNATTPIHPRALEALAPYLNEDFGNPSSPHSWGQRARAGLETARAALAACIGAGRDELIFTSGGTESVNLALTGAVAGRDKGRIVSSAVEHPAVAETLAALERAGHEVVRVPVDRDCRVDMDALKKAVGPGTALVSVMLTNHEVGTIQPLAEIVGIAHVAGAIVHSDAVQALGKTAVDVEELGIDLLSISGHKVYGPKGIGALYVRRGTEVAPAVLGGKQERGLRAGTENVAGAVGFAAAAETATRERDEVCGRMSDLSERLFGLLSGRVPGLTWNARDAVRVAGTMSLTFPGALTGEDLLIALDLQGIAVSLGAACSSGVSRLSPVLRAMGLSDDDSRRTLRLSLGRGTTAAEIDYAAGTVALVWAELAGAKAGAADAGARRHG